VTLVLLNFATKPRLLGRIKLTPKDSHAKQIMAMYRIICYFCHNIQFNKKPDKTMNVSLTKPLKTFVQSNLDSGMYASASEVIHAKLIALPDQVA